MSDPVRIGAVSYLNTLPLVHGMQQGLGADRIRLSFDVPSALAESMDRGELDIALLPVIELAPRHPELSLVPGLGIVANGPSRSVLLIRRCPLKQIRSVALDRDSRTSNALTRLLFADVWRCSPAFEVGPADLERALERHDAVVRIGDKALLEPLPEGTVAEDLSDVWHRATRLPFVFAAWFARPGVVDREVYRILHDSRRQGSHAIDYIAENYRYEGNKHFAIAREYLMRCIRFRLGATEVRAMETFFRAAADRGVIERAPRIRLAMESRSSCLQSVERKANKG